MLHLFNSATSRIEPVEPAGDEPLLFYVCGPTVYGPPHLGHARATITYDILRRFLSWKGRAVVHVSNITDIDDKIIDTAAARGSEWTDVAQQYEKMWWEVMDAVDVERPHHIPRATEYLDAMVDIISRLISSGHAYVADAGVYFDTTSVADYGCLSGQDIDALLAGGGERAVVGESAKRSPSDFVLWKPAKPGEPTWPSPFGDGRPGWHTECVAMSTQLLGDRFHLHAGGQDLRFPHHENERAQAVALGLGFADHWMHHEFVVDPSGEKMSKSLGNFDNMVEFLAQSDPRSLRLLLLQAHYRSPVRLDRDAVARADRTLDGLDAFVRRSASVPAAPADPAVLEAFTTQLDDDFDTPGASALLFDTMRKANAALDTGDAEGPALVAAVTEMLKAVGLRERAEAIPADILEQVAALDAARAAKNFADADRIRGELRDAGWNVETTPQGTRVSR